MQWTERKRGRNWGRRHRLVVEVALMLALHWERSTIVFYFLRFTMDLGPRDCLLQCRLLQGNSRQRNDRSCTWYLYFDKCLSLRVWSSLSSVHNIG